MNDPGEPPASSTWCNMFSTKHRRRRRRRTRENNQTKSRKAVHVLCMTGTNLVQRFVVPSVKYHACLKSGLRSRKGKSPSSEEHRRGEREGWTFLAIKTQINAQAPYCCCCCCFFHSCEQIKIKRVVEVTRGTNWWPSWIQE